MEWKNYIFKVEKYTNFIYWKTKKFRRERARFNNLCFVVNSRFVCYWNKVCLVRNKNSPQSNHKIYFFFFFFCFQSWDCQRNSAALQLLNVIQLNLCTYCNLCRSTTSAINSRERHIMQRRTFIIFYTYILFYEIYNSNNKCIHKAHTSFTTSQVQ